jgi:hypothetical protein
VGTDHLVGVENEQRERGATLGAGQLDRLAFTPYLQWTEHPKLQHQLNVALCSAEKNALRAP